MICEVRCCYCDQLLGHKDCEVPEDMTPVTHGICQKCYDHYFGTHGVGWHPDRPKAPGPN